MSLVWTPTIKRTIARMPGHLVSFIDAKGILPPEEYPKVPYRSDCDSALGHAGKQHIISLDVIVRASAGGFL